MDAHQLCGSLRAAQFRNDLPGVSHATYCSDIRYECKPSVAKRETDGNSGRCHDRYMIEQWAKAAIDARSERACGHRGAIPFGINQFYPLPENPVLDESCGSQWPFVARNYRGKIFVVFIATPR